MSSMATPSVAAGGYYLAPRPSSTWSKKQPSINLNCMFGPSILELEAYKIINRKVGTRLICGETLDCLLDNHVRAKNIGDFPTIVHFLPHN